MSRFHLPFLCGLLLSAGSIPLLIVFARRMAMVDKPAHRKTHSHPVPYLGGLGMVLGFVLGPALCYYFFYRNQMTDDRSRFAAIMAPALAASIVGLIDDQRPIPARFKLLLQAGVALLFVYFGFRIETLEFPGFRAYGLFEFESIPLTLMWMLAVINGVNLIDGIDGLAATVMAVIYAAIAALALLFDQPDWMVTVIAVAGLGATIGFLFYNWQPARIYMGDAGSMANGFLIATLLVALGQHKLGGAAVDSDGEIIFKPYSYQFAKITLIAFYPLMEVVLSVLRRLLSGKPIGSADRGHIHHRLLRWGWTPPMVCGAALLISVLASLTVIFTQVHYLGVASSLFMVGGVTFVLLLHASGFLEIFHPKSIRGSRPHFLIANYFISMQRIKLELAENIGEIAALTEQTCIEFGIAQYGMRLTSATTGAKAFDLEWNKPLMAHSSILLSAGVKADVEPVAAAFSDKIMLASGSQAEWTFDPHAVEEEIDIEYRVLMSDFMHKALGCAEALYRKRPTETGSAVEQRDNSTNVRSSELRRRKHQSDKLNAISTVPANEVPPVRPTKRV